MDYVAHVKVRHVPQQQVARCVYQQKCHQVASKREGTLNFADVKGLLHRELHCPVRLSKHQDFTSS